jgi:probable HAF family extracellular repeat protein
MNRKILLMKSPIIVCIAVMALVLAPAAPVALASQPTTVNYPRFKLIDIGTFGGPNSIVNGPQTRDLSNNGVYGGEADTAIPYTLSPNCPNNGDCFVQHAQAWRNGVISDLGTLPGKNLSSGVTWVGSNGVMVGVSENGLLDPLGYVQDRAVVWSRDGKITNLGTMEGGDWSFAQGINGQGLIVGAALNTIPDPFSLAGLPYQNRTFVYQHGVMQDIGTLGGPDAQMFGINERGQISGISYTSSIPNSSTGSPTLHAFLWENGKMRDLGTLGGTSVFPYNWLNNRGQVVGSSYQAGDKSWHPFLWENGKLKDLGTLGGTNGEAEWISDSGLVAGRADITPSSTIHHAFLWKNGVMADLGVLSTWPCSTAYSVNSKGQVVGDTGICNVGGGPSFFSAGGQPLVDINTLVLPGSNPSNITVVDANQINDRGEIAGGGVLPNGDFHAVVLVPASPAEIAAANSQPLTSQSPRYLPSKGVNGQSMLDAPRNRFLAPFRRFQSMP